MSRTYSPAQSAYLLARAAYEVAREEARALTAAFDAYCDRETEGMTEDEADAWLRALCVNAQPDPVLVAESNARTALTAAEDALIAWAVAALDSTATPKQRADLATLRTARSGPTRDRIVDTMMRLDVTTLPAQRAA